MSIVKSRRFSRSHCLRLWSAGFATLLAATPLTSSATDYFAATQADFNQINARDLEPGDRIFLQGGVTFSGNLSFDSIDSGTDPQGNLIAPIVLTSFGTGRAAIYAGDGPAIVAYNSGGIEISRLDLVGSGVAPDGTTTSTASGIVFFNDSPGNLKFPHVRIDEVDVSGFGDRGVVIGGYNGNSGYDDVRLTRVVAHHNLHCGIEFYGHPGATTAITNVLVERCHAHDNPGDPESNGNTGSGIALGCVGGGVIRHCLANNNGANNTPLEGPVGIWAYHSHVIVIEQCESYQNQTGNGDGCGFDLDLGVTGSVMQYNYSHENAGAGFLVYGESGPDANSGNVVRYNISENDGRAATSSAASGISILNNVRQLQVYGNTVLMTDPPDSTSIPAIKVARFNADPDEILISNNIFVTAGGTRLVYCDSNADVTFAGNNYWSGGASFVIRYDSVSYGSLGSWRNSTGQERLPGQDTGFSVDPRFNEPPPASKSLVPNPQAGLIVFKLKPDSPLINQGLDLKAKFAISPGPRDFFGARVRQGAGHEIGAHEFAVDPPLILGVTHSPAGPSFTIRYQSEIGVPFGVRRSPDLTGSPAIDWAPLAGTGNGDGTVKTYVDTPPPGAACFYVLQRD